jgi:cytochrome b6-f complex iron-sulfur subunit
MDRKEFLSMLGIGAAAAAISLCVESCSKAQTTKTAPTVDFKLDLNQSSNQALLTNGGSLSVQGVIVAKTNAGVYIAVSQACTHQGTSILYRPSNNDFVCPAHGSTFGPSGAVGVGPAMVNLKSYTTQLQAGNILHVYG